MFTKKSHFLFFCKMWFKIFKYISITKRLTRISKALFKALPDVSAFFFVFVILFIGFGLSAHLLFGNDIEKFSSIGETFLTLFRMMLGDWDYDAIVMSAPVMGPVRIMYSIFASCLSLHCYRSCLCYGFALLRSFCSILSSVCSAKRTTKWVNLFGARNLSTKECAAFHQSIVLQSRIINYTTSHLFWLLM